MQTTAPAVTALIEEFAKLPGVGPKTAQRLTFFLLRSPADQSRRLADALVRMKEQVTTCTTCFNITETDPCPICASPQRDHGVICVVEEPLDVLAIEKTESFRGAYHVLNGALSPMEGIGPKDLRISELIARVQGGEVREVILATNPNYEGDYTAAYIAPLLKPQGVTLTRLARGLPLGGDLEYADEGTLSRALEGRRAFEG
ncbi:MAG: recombination protein RecR [Ktedonobacterales bacterium]|nr:recombination protein RecR [Ktedonobacterales bacterium]